MGILVNLIDNFFKSLQKGVSDRYQKEVDKAEVHPVIIEMSKKMHIDGQRLDKILFEKSKTHPKEKKNLDNIKKERNINNSDSKKNEIKKRNEIIKQVKLKFESYYTDLNDKNITEEFDIIKYLKKEYKESDLFCQEFIESYIDRIEYLKYEKEINEKSKIRRQYFIDKNEKIRKREAEIIQKYGKEIAAKILKGKYWKGMTKAMLVESLGNPGTKKVDIFKDNEKLKFYYNKKRNQLGNWSFTLKISLENNKVVGWKDLDLISKRIDLD
jgi:hypothetical protein